MNRLIYLLFLSIFLLDFLSKQGWVSRIITWFPDILSIIMTLIICVLITVGKARNFPAKISVFLLLFVVNLLIGVLLNLVSPGPLIAGLRSYLKFIPFFILPFLYHFSPEQIKGQVKCLLFLYLFQFPVTLYQKFVISKGYLTGDFVRGTFSTSGHLTIAHCCAIAVLMGFYLKKTIEFRVFALLFIIIFLPTTLNETKSTLILLPLALILPVIFSSKDLKFSQFVPIIVMGVCAGFAFIYIYDYLIRDRWGYGLLEFFSKEGRLEGYLYKGAADSTAIAKVGRGDSYVLAFKTLSDNLLTLLFGLGIGNVTESFIPGFSGQYAIKYSDFEPNKTSLTILLWEVGIFGLILYYYLFFMVFKYAKRLIGLTNNNVISALATGWSSIAIIIMIAVPYKNFITENIISYLFWYFSGYVIAECFRIERQQVKT